MFHAGTFHARDSSMLDHLVLDCKDSHEKLAWMSIHEQIKAARLAKGWSQGRLAKEVSDAENLAKPLTYQTVQQWENGTSAPKRKRLKLVADLLDTPLLEMMDAMPPEAAEESAQAWPLGEEVSADVWASLPETIRTKIRGAAEYIAHGPGDGPDAAEKAVRAAAKTRGQKVAAKKGAGAKQRKP